MNKYYYCTLFDSHYMTRGLAMYESLKQYSDNFHLYVFTFNDLSHTILKNMALENMTVISLQEFEDDKLLAVKPTRDVAEYCWTCTPSIIKYCLDNYDIDHCTYVDADVYFFSNPAILVDEMGDKSVLITEHRYTPKYDQSATSGIYCVQFMTFKKDKNGMQVLEWWREACLAWCYRRAEDGKFGDQKYLDDWTTRFDGVYVLKHLGGGVAPWNMQQYDMNNLGFELVFFHFHALNFLSEKQVNLSHYDINRDIVKCIYKPYISHLVKIYQNLEKAGYLGNFQAISSKMSVKDWLRLMRQKLRQPNAFWSVNELENL